MMYLQVPKYLDWKDTRIPQHYHCNKNLLITSGCSFTSSTMWLEGAASWPGYTRDRCGFHQAIDMSFPGAGNFFIADSIKYAIEKCCEEQDPGKILVIVMWSGIDRAEYIQIADTFNGHDPMLDNLVYKRLSQDLITDQVRRDTTNQSLACIKNLIEYLEQKSIAWVFTSYANLLFPPFVPKRDTTHHWKDYLDSDLLEQLKAIPWVPEKGMDYLYEWAFVNNYLDKGDRFHPPNEANYSWTDSILLPSLEKRGFITKI